ncbi:polysaccharide biosynthesis protein, partial [bacterium]|nr:polysaccharide biosynthesis protein [bacterium]
LLVIETMVIGENAATYILEMGDPVSIMDLARNMLALAGYDPENGDLGPGIVSTGLRPGEKLHEALVDTDERLGASRNPLINRALSLRERACDPDGILATLLEPARRGEMSGVRAALAQVLGSPEFPS